MKEHSRVLVTGGAGFLGSHLCERLIESGHSVLCLDNFYTGKKSNLSRIVSHPKFKVIEHNVCEPIDVEVDAIFSLACPASPVHYQREPIETTKTSVLGALNMLELAKRNQCPVLLTSTSEVYGDPHEHPQKETYWGHVNSIGVRSCYDEGKRCAESLFMDYHRCHGTDIRIARIFNTYGPNMCPLDGRVVSNFIVQALNNEPITIYGTGEQSRSFCYVADTISGLMKLMDRQGLHTPVNIGNPIERTMKEIAEIILRLTNSDSQIEYHPLPSDDPKQRRPDISKAKAELHWEPKVTLEEGLIETIAYFKTQLQEKEAAA